MKGARLPRGVARAVAWALALTAALGCEATLEAGLSEGEANQMIVALHAQGVGATKESEGPEGRYRVRVTNDDVARALDVLRDEGLPRRDAPGFAEVFGQPGLVPTATEERARYVAALGGELSRTIAAFDGVVEARVHVAVPERRRLALDEAPPTPRASVFVRHRAEPPDEAAIRALVAGAVEGLAEDAVTVVVQRTSQPATPADAGLAQLGPIAVSRGSATILKAVLGAAFLLHLVLAAALVIAWRRRRA
ncbi:MAG: secretion protein [Myxococcales bacterium]|nr:secretion protein [Myxococcales bacterium]